MVRAQVVGVGGLLLQGMTQSPIQVQARNTEAVALKLIACSKKQSQIQVQGRDSETVALTSIACSKTQSPIQVQRGTVKLLP